VVINHILCITLAVVLCGCVVDFPEGLLPRPDGDVGVGQPDGPRADGGPAPDRLVRLDTVKPDTLAVPTRINGQACTVSGECLSGYCVDKVCCNRACSGACKVCNISGKNGTCQYVAEGSSPPTGKSCSSTASSTCGNDGKCNGVGSCRKWPDGTVCTGATCSANATLDLASHCDGAGKCRSILSTTADTIDCAPHKCETNICGWGCTNPNKDCLDKSSDCQNGSCDGAAKALGLSCTSNTQCASGFCSDGYCCESACAENCKTCRLSGARGRCVNVPKGSKPPTGKSCPVAGGTCGTDGTCDGAGGCRVAPKGVICSSTVVCLDEATSSHLEIKTCNGLATAPACVIQTISCGNYKCQTKSPSCFGRCTESSQCKAGLSCVKYRCTN
jgi:hypothetical protein